MPGSLEGAPHQVTIRMAVQADSDSILEISNDPKVRANSFRNDAITPEEHALWFDRHIRDPKRPFYVLEVDGRVAGQVRFEPHGGEMRLSYSIAREFRGQGLATGLVAGGCAAMRRQLGPLDVVATTLRDNLRSQRVLELVGFRTRDLHPDRVELVLEGDAPVLADSSQEARR